MKLLHFHISLYRAPAIIATYSVPDEDAAPFIEKLRAASGREFHFGELEGKHSQTRFTGKKLLDSLKVIEEPMRVAAFSVAFGELARTTYNHPEWRWVGSHDIIATVQESFDDE